MTDTDMKNKGRREGGREICRTTGSERLLCWRPGESSFCTPSLCSVISYLLELEELLLDLEPLGRRLVGLAPDELEHLVAAAADGPLRRMHHVGGRRHGDDSEDDAGVFVRPVGALHCTVGSRTMGAR